MRAEVLFDCYNREYFSGRLPAYRIDRSGKYIGGRCDRGRRLIFLPPESDIDDISELLMHEMCHAASNGAHGPAWLSEMRRVRALGAPVRAQEISMYANKQVISRSGMIDRVARAALNYPNAPVEQLVLEVSFDYGVVTSEGKAESAWARTFVKDALRAARRGRRGAGILRGGDETEGK
jgi:SprT-like family